MTATLAALGIAQVSGVLLDLGVSSPQIDDPERGFSFRFDGPLDMRMDTTRGESAAEFLARADERHIAEVIRDYGEERFALQVAKALVARRESGRAVRTTGELADVVAGAVKTREAGQNPATRTFQALRIFVNAELEELEQALSAALALLAPGRTARRHQLPFARGPDRQDLHRPREPERVRPARAVRRRRGRSGCARSAASSRRPTEAATQPARALGGDARRRAHRRAARRGSRGVTRLNVAAAAGPAREQPLPGARLVRVAPPLRRARQGAERGARARHRQRAAEDRAALAGDAAARRADGARAAGDAQRRRRR